MLQLKETWTGLERRSAVLHGIKRMLRSGLRTIAPQHLDEELLSKWFSIASLTVDEMVHTAARKLYGEKGPEKPTFIEKIEGSLRWGEIVDELGKDILEKLGFLWYADEKLCEGEPNPKELFDLVGGISEEEKKKIVEILEKEAVSYVIFPF